jgi:rod shape-determining protein MreC
MASSRDDFVIAIRSAFLKKSTKQNFSLLTLTFLSIFILILSSFNFKIILNLRSVINEIVYRSSFVVSIPENFLKKSYVNVIQYSNFYDEYKENRLEIKKLKSENISSEIVISENKELKELIEDYTLTTNKILAKVIVDHKSPYLRSIIINKGSTDKIKIGTNIYDRSYLVGRVVEVNYKSSRVLLLSDLNSSIPVSIIPGNIQAIIVGNGKNSGKIKYIKDNLIEDIEDQSIAYTSGTGSIFKSGKPVGKLEILDQVFLVNFYSNFSQLKYVFAEVEESNLDFENTSETSLKNTEKIKINILNEEIEILNDSNLKLLERNKVLKLKTDQLDQTISNLNTKIKSQSKEIDQIDINQKELEFLRLNLIYSSKCQKTAFKRGYRIGTKEYRSCIYSKGKKIND